MKLIITSLCALISITSMAQFNDSFVASKEMQIMQQTLQSNNIPTSFFDPETCVLAQPYDSIFTGCNWSELDMEWGRTISSSGIYGYYRLRLNADGTFTTIEGGYNPFSKSKRPHRYTQLSGKYRFDKANCLLNLKWDKNSDIRLGLRRMANGESVFKVGYYRNLDLTNEYWQEALVLQPQSLTPVKGAVGCYIFIHHTENISQWFF